MTGEPLENFNNPKEADMEFQRFVAASLAIVWKFLEKTCFVTFPPHLLPWTGSSYARLSDRPGDELLIRAWSIDINYRTIVDRTGTIYIPKIGAMSVAGSAMTS